VSWDDNSSGESTGRAGFAAPTIDALTIAELRANGSLKWLDYAANAPGHDSSGDAVTGYLSAKTWDNDVIGAFVAEMDFGTAPAVTKALTEAVTKYQYGYLPKHLELDFRRAFCEFAGRRYGWAVAPRQVRHIPDVLAGIEAVVRIFMPDDAPIILPTPTYMPFLPLFHDLGKTVIQVPMIQDESGRYLNDLAGIAAAFQAGAMWLVLVNPHNPTGRVLSRVELQDLAALVTKHDGRVLADEIHAPLVYPGQQHIPYASLSPITASQTITAVSASKAWNLAGLKAAQLIITNSEDLALWRRKGGWVEHMTATLGVIASIAAYDKGEAWLAEVLGYLAENRQLLSDYLATELPYIGFYPPEGTYLAWLDLRNTNANTNAIPPDNAASLLLEQAGVAVTDGRECGPAGKGFVRLNFATPRPILQEALGRIAGVLHPSGPG